MSDGNHEDEYRITDEECLGISMSRSMEKRIGAQSRPTYEELEQRLEASESRCTDLERHSHFTICSYCGYITDCGTNDLEVKCQKARDHILECDKRPENQLIDAGIDQERKIKELEAQLTELRQPMACGHVKACLEFTADEVETEICTACAASQAQLERVTANLDHDTHQFLDELGVPKNSCGGEQYDGTHVRIEKALRASQAERLQGLPAWQAWLDAKMACGHAQRYRTGIEGKTDSEWIQLECDECVICASQAEREALVREVMAEHRRYCNQCVCADDLCSRATELAERIAVLQPKGAGPK